VEWESGEITYKPLDMIGKDDPVTYAEYAHRMNLLSIPGWKPFRHIYKDPKKVGRMVNQAKLRSYRREPFWKFGVMVPRTHNQAVDIDQSEATEMKQLTKYKTFIDKVKGGTPPDGYKKIRCHMVDDVKHDGRAISVVVNSCCPIQY
jgi:hypothetical protein